MIPLGFTRTSPRNSKNMFNTGKITSARVARPPRRKQRNRKTAVMMSGSPANLRNSSKRYRPHPRNSEDHQLAKISHSRMIKFPICYHLKHRNPNKTMVHLMEVPVETSWICLEEPVKVVLPTR